MFVASLYNLKGGVGKTASCVNFAYMAAQDGYKTLIWDLDPQGAASFYYKVQPKTNKAKKSKELGLDDAIMSTDYELLDIIPANSAVMKLSDLQDGSISKKHFKGLIKGMEHEYDFIFIDCPAGISPLADNVFHVSDAILMPVIPTTLSVRSYELVKEYLTEKNVDLAKLMCFYTMVDIRKNMHNDVMRELYKDKRFFEYYIPNLSDIEKMGIYNAPVEAYAPSSYAAMCYRALWTEIKEGVLE